MEPIFANWKQRCSSLGYIMTCLPEPITTEQLKALEELQKEKETGVNANGNKTKWTDKKQTDLNRLLKIQKGEDELPPGAITHLEDVFRSRFWKRKRMLYNKYLEKGNLVEEDSLGLLSKLDNQFYKKNEELLSNDYLEGTPDNRQLKIKDTKSNFDMDSFDKADSNPLYEWQIRGYLFIDEDNPDLITTTEGDICYCLVNTPVHRLMTEKNSLFYAMGCPEENNPKWIEAVCQLERNHIFDIAAFRKENPNYDLMSERLIETPDGPVQLKWEYDVPPEFRVKRFPVEFTKEHKEHIERRVIMARTWLCQRELEVIEKLNLAS